MEGIAVDSQSRGSLDLDAVTALKDLLDQLAFNLSDDAVVQIVGDGTGRGDTLSNELGTKSGEIGSTNLSGADWPWWWLSPKLGGQELDGQLRSGAENHGSFDIILEFTDISWPIVFA